MSLHPDLLRETRRVRGGGAWIWLFRLPFDISTAASQVAYLCAQREPIIFDDGQILGLGGTGGPKTFHPYPIQHSGIESNSEGNLPTMQISIADPLRLIGKWMFVGRGLSGETATVWLVHQAHLDTPAAHSRWQFVVGDISPGPQSVSISLDTQSPHATKLPAENFSRRLCGFRFGDEGTCGFPLYAGGPTKCNKTVEQCRQYGAIAAQAGYPRLWPRQFGGHPGIEESIA